MYGEKEKEKEEMLLLLLPLPLSGITPVELSWRDWCVALLASLSTLSRLCLDRRERENISDEEKRDEK